MLVFLFGGVFLVRISSEFCSLKKFEGWRDYIDHFRISTLQHAKVMFHKIEVRCKAEIVNGTVTYVNTKSGFSMNISVDINQELRNVSVIFLNEAVFTLLYFFNGLSLSYPMFGFLECCNPHFEISLPWRCFFKNTSPWKLMTFCKRFFYWHLVSEF